MALNESAKASASANALPPCPTCQTDEHTTPVHLHDLSPGVRYWRCTVCGAVWATDERTHQNWLSAAYSRLPD
jgi:formate dehydrogenase maturation protein FdhE